MSSLKHILIAEDEHMLGEMLHYELSQHVPTVSVARDGEQAIEYLSNQKPDMLLLDLLMPKKDGFAVLQYLQKINNTVPVIVLSNLADPKEKDTCLRLGAKDFMVKSQLDPEFLWEKIQKYVE